MLFAKQRKRPHYYTGYHYAEDYNAVTHNK